MGTLGLIVGGIIIILFYKYTRVMLGVSGILIVLGLIGILLFFAYFAFYDWKEKRLDKKISVSVEQSHEQCQDNEYPLLIRIQNSSSKNLIKTSWYFQVKEKGHSTDLSNQQSYEIDYIIPPNKTYRNCFSFPSMKPEGYLKSRSDLEIVPTNIINTFE